MRRKKTYIATIMAAAIVTSVAVQTPVAVFADEEANTEKDKIETGKDNEDDTSDEIDDEKSKEDNENDNDNEEDTPVADKDDGGNDTVVDNQEEDEENTDNDDETETQNTVYRVQRRSAAAISETTSLDVPSNIKWRRPYYVCYEATNSSYKMNFELYRLPDESNPVATGNKEEVSTNYTSSGIDNFIDYIKAKGGQYKFRARQYDSNGNTSDWVWSDTMEYIISDTPSHIKASGTTISWNATNDKSDYQIEIINSSGGEVLKLENVKGTNYDFANYIGTGTSNGSDGSGEDGESRVRTKLEEGVTYKFRIMTNWSESNDFFTDENHSVPYIYGDSQWSDYIEFTIEDSNIIMEEVGADDTKDEGNEKTENNEDAASNDADNESSSDSSESTSSDSNEETTSSTTTTESQPTVGSSSGWSAIDSEISKVISQPVTTDAVRALNVKLSNSDFIPASALKAVASSNVILSANIANDTVINIDSSQIDESATSYTRFTSEETPNGETSITVNTAGKDVTKNITIFKKMKPEDIGKIITLYFIDENGNRIPFRVSYVYENGYAAFETPFVHANYVITVD